MLDRVKDAVTVPVGGAGVGIFYVQPVAVITQSLSGIIYLCDSGVPTTTAARL